MATPGTVFPEVIGRVTTGLAAAVKEPGAGELGSSGEEWSGALPVFTT